MLFNPSTEGDGKHRRQVVTGGAPLAYHLNRREQSRKITIVVGAAAVEPRSRVQQRLQRPTVAGPFRQPAVAMRVSVDQAGNDQPIRRVDPGTLPPTSHCRAARSPRSDHPAAESGRAPSLWRRLEPASPVLPSSTNPPVMTAGPPSLPLQDTAAIGGSGGLDGASPYRPSQGRQVHLEPVSLIAALAAVTTHIGLISTATTTYNEPYNIARRFATIDHISGGRAGWNLVTSQVEDEAGNFGLDRHVDHARRYDRAGEFYDVVAGLWDSWEEDAFLRDKESGIWFDFDKMHFLHHRGEHFSVRGPLNVSRTPQGRPVVAQAGSSDVGRELAARSADLVFTAQITIEEGRAFCDDLRGRAERHGRGRNDIKILPGLMPIVGRTDAEAAEQFQQLQELIDDSLAIRAVARLAGGLDIQQFPLDGPLPPLPPSNAAKARQQLIVDLARKENLTIRQVARYLGTSAGPPRSAWLGADHRRLDGGMAARRRLRRLQSVVSVLPGPAQRFRRSRGAGTATPRHLPHRI
jgi:FMN-dependent oxidoreductase (nitrilotriacetate monooxygenase family)